MTTTNTSFLTPLRYPGGKAQLAPWLANILKLNRLEGGTYVEPYAGGCGAGIYLLLNGHIRKLVINDLDPAIHAFWWAVLYNTKDFLNLVKSTPITLQERDHQKRMLISPSTSMVELGFATFYLNRTNRSGILKAGVIGGKAQDGKYLLDARFNKSELISRIERISTKRDQIELYRLDAREFISDLSETLSPKSLVYLDPPYFVKGSQLYRNFYKEQDHVEIASLVQSLETPWIVTYDSCDAIKNLYKGSKESDFETYHSTHLSRLRAKELMYFGNLDFINTPYLKRSSPGNFDEALGRFVRVA